MSNGITVWDILIFFIAGLGVGVAINYMSDQDLIDAFKGPVCVERTVGKDLVRKCYELKEVPEFVQIPN